MQTNRKKLFLILLFVLLFSGGIVGGYIYFSNSSSLKRQQAATPEAEQRQSGDFSSVRVYYPSEGRLVIEDRRVRRHVSIAAAAAAVIEEFLKGPSTVKNSNVPAGAKLLGIYPGSDGILYVDLSDEFRRNFQGDALAEALLLRGIYESVISNMTGIDDVKIIIEGREIESIGGHIMALYPLRSTFTEVK